MLSLLRLRSSVAPTLSSAQYAASAHLPAVLWRSLPPALAWRAPPSYPPARRVFSSMATTTITTSGIKGDDGTSSLAKACNDEQDGRTAAVHGDKHTRKKIGHDIFLRCGDGPPGERSDDEELRRLEKEDQYADHHYNYPDDEDVDPSVILPYSTHRDGSIYRGGFTWRKEYRIANRNETRIEAMMLSDPKDCTLCKGREIIIGEHVTNMMQIFSLKLAKIDVDGGPIELYGYIATRDVLEPLLNYIVNVSRNDPITIEQGSLIEMTGPKRGIELCGEIMLEFDMRIKRGGEEKDDPQLIDGVAIVLDEMSMPRSTYAFTKRIHGDCGAVDITVSRLDFAVEATIQLHVSEVEGSFSLRAGCFTSGLCEEIQIFKGTISEPRALRRCVVAAVHDTWMDVKLKVDDSGHSYSSDDNPEHWCSFKTTSHGWTCQQASLCLHARVSFHLIHPWFVSCMLITKHAGFAHSF
eukprot:XP_020394020.1 uncharacterized protein LOC103626633 isoform X2 [Zea mays]